MTCGQSPDRLPLYAPPFEYLGQPFFGGHSWAFNHSPLAANFCQLLLSSCMNIFIFYSFVVELADALYVRAGVMLLG
eukprot:c28478_g1_i1 orf=3-230(-)